MLKSLAYVSRAMVPADDASMLDLARACLRNNARLGITGALYFDGNQFFQVLEGDPTIVEILFDTIRHDPRHDDVQVVWCKPITQRRFADWSMKFVDGHAQKGLADRFAYECVTHPSDSAHEERLAALEAA